MSCEHAQNKKVGRKQDKKTVCRIQFQFIAHICTDQDATNLMKVLLVVVPRGTTMGGIYFSFILFCIPSIV